EGDAEYNAPFSVGSHSVSASYSGDNSYNKSSASAVSFTIVKDTPAIGISASNQDSSGNYISGQPTVLNIQVLNGAAYVSGNPANRIVYPVPIAAPTGTVTVSGIPGGTLQGSLKPGTDPSYQGAEGIATVTIPASTAAGNYSITVSYSGDSNYNSTSGSGTISVVSASGLASTTTANVSGSISPSTSVSVTGTVTGQSGQPAPTGNVIVYSSGYSLGEVALTAGSGDVSSFSFALNSQTLQQGANFVTVQYTGDSTYAPSAYQLSTLSNALSDFTMIPQTTIVPVTIGSSGNVVINLSSTNSFSGTVSLSCTASTVTCSLSNSSPTLSAGGSNSITLEINAGSSVAAGSYNVTVAAHDSTSQYIHTLAIEAQVMGAPPATGFTLTNSGDLVLKDDETGTSTITTTPSGGFTGSVALSCRVSEPTIGVTCNMMPASVGVTGTSAVNSLLIVQAGPASGALEWPLDKLFALGGGATLGLLVLFGIPARSRTWRKLICGLVFGAIIGVGLGCGVERPASRNYTVTVTGTSGSITETTVVKVTVNKIPGK
ncbi:MAG: Ig-like domain repeat protein, partial [Silvibacterium sp.]|nr:Ig-like domain repeat protein [Silvibacterium sp.]